MVDQVTFPPSIGGSGKTYTNDANPQTGMFNGGHRINFFPIQSDMIAAAGYVSQYAQAIDGAKANADRAENARGYVEAVADAYQVNILDAYRRKTTLDLDFERGIYRADGGVLTETNNPNLGGVGEVQSGTGLVLQGIDGYLRQTPSDEIGRVWHNGVPRGFAVTPESGNILLNNRDLSHSDWSTVDSSVEFDATQVDPEGNSGVYKLVANDGATNPYLTQGATVIQGEYCTQSIYVKSAGATEIELRHALIAYNRVRFNLATKQFTIVGGTEDQRYGFEELRGGWFRVFTKDIPEDTTTGTVRIYQYNAQNGEDGLYLWNPQLEQGSILSPPIATQSAPVFTGASGCDFMTEGKWGSEGFTVLTKVNELIPLEEAFDYMFFVSQVRNSTTDDFLGVSVRKVVSGVQVQFRSNLFGTRAVDLQGFDFTLGVSISKGIARFSVNGQTVSSRSTNLEDLIEKLKWFRLGGVSSTSLRPTFNCEKSLILPYPLQQPALNEVTSQ